jgi:hypothetical protein
VLRAAQEPVIELASKLAELRNTVAALAKDVAELKATRPGAPAPATDGARPRPEPAATGGGLNPAERLELAALRAEVERLRAQPVAVASGVTDALAREQHALSEKALEAARAELKTKTVEIERIEGELQSLKLLQDETKEKTRAAVASVTDLKLDSKSEGIVRAIVVDRDKLQEDKARVDSELSRIKTEATKRITALKSELDKATKAHETVRMQKDNLMRQLRERDEAADTSREITLEDITSSEVFKQMLGNIRRTSRAEVTTIHDAIATLKAIDPSAYETVLEVVAKHFQKAQIENPLATLPRD